MKIFGHKINEVALVALLSFIFWIYVYFLGSGIPIFSTLIVFLTLLWIYISHKIAQSAARKNRNYQSFFFLSLLVSPILMGIIVAVIPEPNK
jgi:heme O synthase-like polyprenyltransferase